MAGEGGVLRARVSAAHSVEKITHIKLGENTNKWSGLKLFSLLLEIK